jgi:hypothetical protein
MKANQDALISNLKQADAGLEKFLELIEKTNQKQKSLNERERLLQELYSLPINDSTLLKNLFKEKTNQTGIKSLLNDLMTYHNLVATIDKLKEIEASLATNSDAESLEIPQSALRKSMEENLRQVSFKAIQCTVGLVNKDIVSLLQLPEKALVRVLKPICQLKEIKPVLFSQYCSHQKLRIKDVISSWQVSVRKGQIEVFFSLVLESLARFCIYDLSVFLGKNHPKVQESLAIRTAERQET